MDSREEEQVIKQCQQGKMEEFGRLYDKYFDKIYRFLYYKTSHRETAEDLTSDVFHKALLGIKKFKLKKGTFQAWLFSIARNRVIDYYRTKKDVSNIDEVWGLHRQENLDRELDNKSKLEKVHYYLSQLDGLQREVVMLRAWENMSYKEIGEILGKTEGACKMIFLRTVKKMKTNLSL